MQSFLNQKPAQPYLENKASVGAAISVRISGNFRWSSAVPAAWGPTQAGGWEKIAGYKFMLLGIAKLIRRCFGCAPLKQDAGKAIAAKTQADDWEAAHKADGSPEVLRDMDIEIQAGSLVALIGKVGSGKTSILCDPPPRL